MVYLLWKNFNRGILIAIRKQFLLCRMMVRKTLTIAGLKSILWKSYAPKFFMHEQVTKTLQSGCSWYWSPGDITMSMWCCPLNDINHTNLFSLKALVHTVLWSCTTPLRPDQINNNRIINILIMGNLCTTWS